MRAYFLQAADMSLELREAPQPRPGPDQMLVRVRAAGLNRGEFLKHGLTKPGAAKIGGTEGAGEVEGTGERVMGYTQFGAAAEKIAVSKSLLWPQPARWTSVESAAFPVTFLTAYLAYWKAGLTPDAKEPVHREPGHKSRVLIHAVAGGVGTAAVEIGKQLGIEMYGTSSSDEKLARVQELGLQHGINYKQVDYEQRVGELTKGEGVDAVFEMLGGEHTAKSLRCCRPFGRVIIYGTATGERQKFDVGVMMAKGLSAHGLWLTYLARDPELILSSLRAMQPWIDSGDLHPEVGHVLPLEQAAQAHRLMLQRANYGKIVLKVSG